MENIIEELNSLLKTTSDTKIKSSIKINDINNLLIFFENKKPIPINYYCKNLVEIKNNKNKCNKCSKIAQYKYNNDILCWNHAHSLL
jgi:hypothetical protein